VRRPWRGAGLAPVPTTPGPRKSDRDDAERSIGDGKPMTYVGYPPVAAFDGMRNLGGLTASRQSNPDEYYQIPVTND